MTDSKLFNCIQSLHPAPLKFTSIGVCVLEHTPVVMSFPHALTTLTETILLHQNLVPETGIYQNLVLVSGTIFKRMSFMGTAAND